MAAILRVKRKNTDVPLDTLVIACKRPKTESSLSDISPVPTVLQFAGTLTDPTEDVTSHVAKALPKMDAGSVRVGVKRTCESNCPANILEKIPKWVDDDSVKGRYKVTDCQRSLDISHVEEFKNKWMTLIDVEDSWSISRPADEITEEKEDIEDFVYDLYYAQTCEDIWFESDNIMVWRPEHSETNSEHESESSDSNSESNWRNDYPDTDPDRSRDSNSDSDDYFDVYQTDEDLYGSKRDENTNLFGYNYSEYRRGRREESESSFNSDLDETYSSDNEERLTNDKEEMTD